MKGTAPGPVRKPRGVQRKRARGFRLPKNTVCVDRTSTLWGNPYRVGYTYAAGTVPDASTAVALYERWLESSDRGKFVAQLARERLRGWNLACFCAEGSPCHRDILLRVANGRRK